MTKKQKATKGKRGTGIHDIYISVLQDFEKKKEKILKDYLEKSQKIKKQGLKEIEKAMDKEESKAAEKLLEDL